MALAYVAQTGVQGPLRQTHGEGCNADTARVEHPEGIDEALVLVAQ